MTTPVLGILMILITIGLVFSAVAIAVVRRLQNRRPPLARSAAVLAGWATVYAVVLVAVSLASEPRTLGLGENKKFCGFYIDCHRQIAVAAVDRLDSIGATRPEGVFYVLSLRIGSDAKVARMRLIDPQLAIVDADGRRHLRSAAGEAALAQERGPLPALTDTVGPGGSYVTTVVFDLPRDAREPRLTVTDGWWADRLIEFFLVGDEDSFLHRRTTFRLDA